MPASDPCPRCGEAPPHGAPAGLCPRCLLREGLDLGPPPAGAGTSDPWAAADEAGTFVAHSPSLPGLGLGRGVTLAIGDTEAVPVVLPDSPEVPASSSTGRYQLLGEIARGGMGAVLKGRDPELGRDLAVKVL